jgi:hypothetical protein
MTRSFLARVNGTGNNQDGRLFRITPLEPFPAGGDDYVPVDCRDVRSRFEAQAIIEAGQAKTPDTILADSQVRDAIVSAYYNATSHESGQYPVGGTRLPDGFTVIVLGP